MRALLRNVGLPRNSKIGTGKIWPAPEGARRAKAFEIYRFDPDRHEGPRIDTSHSRDCGLLQKRRDQHLSPLVAIRVISRELVDERGIESRGLRQGA
jgi:hypothetical protein